MSCEGACQTGATLSSDATSNKNPVGTVSACDLPRNALLRQYVAEQTYTDCFVTTVRRSVSLQEYVAAFYASSLFALERYILKWGVSKPSSRADIGALADGTATTFAAWSVEARRADELLLQDYLGRTRSWLKCVPIESGDASETAMFFGSAIVFSGDANQSEARSKALYWALLPFHKLYSRGLLWSARRNLGGS